MEIAVQWVRTSWTKRSRGGAEAARRNATPIAFPLPSLEVPLQHEVFMREMDDFTPTSTIRHGMSVGDDSGVLLHEVDGLLRVQLVASRFGMPRRGQRPPAVRLASGQWLRWQINYRFTSNCDGAWRYRLETLNLCYGRPTRDLFLGEPSRYVNELGALR